MKEKGPGMARKIVNRLPVDPYGITSLLELGRRVIDLHAASYITIKYSNASTLS